MMKPFIATLLAVGCTANQPPLVGNGGYAPYFDWNTHSDALTLHWTDIPKTAITMEFWYMVTDPYLYATTLFSYGAYNAEGRHSAGGDTYEQANEVRTAFATREQARGSQLTTAQTYRATFDAYSRRAPLRAPSPPIPPVMLFSKGSHA